MKTYYYPTEEAARILGIARNTLYEKRKDGILPNPEFKIGKCFYYTEGQVISMRKILESIKKQKREKKDDRRKRL